jgi:Tol biopolymer transport system component
VFPQGWSSDRNHIILLEDVDDSGVSSMYSVATVGGELEFIMKIDCEHTCDLSRDGTAFATRIRDTDGYFRVAISSPLGSPLKIYSPDPFAGKADYADSNLTFAPNGKKIFYSFVDEKTIQESWVLPYPAGSGVPNRVLEKPLDAGSVSWMPDSKHLLISRQVDDNAPFHLAITNISSGALYPLTTGTTNEGKIYGASYEGQAVASPDGKSILYTQRNGQEDVISVSLVDGATTTLISSGHFEGMPAWSAAQAKLVWVTNRSGSPQLWMRMPDGSERPVLTSADFPEAGLPAMPSLSPDGERLIYDGNRADGAILLWIFSLLGGHPVRLTDVQSGGEYAGSWSPDGSHFTYLQAQGGKTSLMVTKTTGNATTVLLRDNVVFASPDWSPTGDWITYRDEKGWNLISPDGKRSKFLGKIRSNALAFSKDGKLLYGLENGMDRSTLFSLDPASLKQTAIKELGKDFIPARDTVRFSLAPDGKSFVYSVDKDRRDLWMLTGYRLPGLWNQIKDAFGSKGGN